MFTYTAKPFPGNKKVSTCPDCGAKLYRTQKFYSPKGWTCTTCCVVWTKSANGFKSGSGCYTCSECGKRTRDTGDYEGSLRLCKDCHEAQEWANAILDGYETLEDIPEAKRSLVEKFL